MSFHNNFFKSRLNYTDTKNVNVDVILDVDLQYLDIKQNSSFHSIVIAHNMLHPNS